METSGGKWIRPDKRLAIYLRDGLACVWCGWAIEDGERLSLDHITPHSKGGSNGADNLIACCLRCNSSRQDRSIDEFAQRVVEYHKKGDPSEILARIEYHKKGDPSEILARIEHKLGLDLAPYRDEAKRIIARRKDERTGNPCGGVS